MSGRLKSAAAWLGLVADDRYDDYEDSRVGRDRGRGRDDYDDEYTEDVELTEDVDDERSAEIRELESRRSRRHEGARESTRGESGRGEAARGGSGRGESTRTESSRDERSRPADREDVDDQERTTRPKAELEEETKVADLSLIITVCPNTYNEARTIGEHFRDSVPVIMNLSEMSDADAKRLVDFAAGLIFGLRGSIERVTNKVFLLSPKNVKVTAEDKERIAGGFYNQS